MEMEKGVNMVMARVPSRHIRHSPMIKGKENGKIKMEKRFLHMSIRNIHIVRKLLGMIETHRENVLFPWIHIIMKEQ
jgi:hypothetical protein